MKQKIMICSREMIKQMMHVFENQTHELHTKSGLFIFSYTGKNVL